MGGGLGINSDFISEKDFLKLSPTKRAWFRVFALVNRDMESYLNEPYISSSNAPIAPTNWNISDIVKPELPPVRFLKKSTFDNYIYQNCNFTCNCTDFMFNFYGYEQ